MDKNSIPTKSSIPAKIGLVLAGAARDAVVAALAQAGYEVHVAANISRVRSLLARNTVDAWIFDARADDVLDLLLTTDCLLLPADNIPDTVQSGPFSLWVEGLMMQLQAALTGRAVCSGLGQRDRWHEHGCLHRFFVGGGIERNKARRTRA